MHLPDIYKALIIVLSDRASRGDYKDLSGPEIRKLLSEFFTSLGWSYIIDLKLIPDDPGDLEAMFREAGNKYNLIITSGGTGIGPRDITVETIRPFLVKEIPGIMEFIRVKYGSINPSALLSRGVAGITGKSLVYTLPGSVKAVKEYLEEIFRSFEHTVMMQYGIDIHVNIKK